MVAVNSSQIEQAIAREPRSIRELLVALMRDLDGLFMGEELAAEGDDRSSRRQAIAQRCRELEEAARLAEDSAVDAALVAKRASDLVAHASHELRAPLGIMHALSRILADNEGGRLSDRQIEYAETIHQTCADLLSVVGELLDFSKIKSGTTAVVTEDVDLTRLRGVLDHRFREQASKKGLGFSITIAESAPRSIHTDAQKLKQVLTNLLANALKFTESGQVDVRFEAATSGYSLENASLAGAGSVVAFVVTDTGIGIPEHKQKLIFEPFQQADERTGKKYGGSGLGLAISREIAKVLGGEITLSSQRLRGSTFTLFLPDTYRPLDASALSCASAGAEPAVWRERAPDARPAGALAKSRTPPSAAAPSLAPDPLLTGKKVLIIDDDMRDIFAITSYLERQEMSVLHAESGRRGIEILQSAAGVSAVLVDAAMPEMDGAATIRAIRTLPGLKEVPIIALTLSPSDEGVEACIEAGASTHTSKPVEQERLLSILRARLEGPKH